MTTPRELQATLTQQALSLGLAALVTTGVLAGVQGLAAAEQGALMARQTTSTPQAIATVLVLPTA